MTVRTDASGSEARAPDYRDSHRDAEQARSYEEEFSNAATPSGVLWELEQILLEGFFESHREEHGDVESALDFACGTGRILGLLEPRVDRLVGVDISPEMLARAARRCPRAELVRGDVTRQPDLVGDSFQLVTAFRFFLRAQPELRGEVLRWIRGRVRDDGYFIANFHLNPWSLRGLHCRLLERATGRHFPSLKLREVERMLTESGFEIEHVHGYMHLLYRGMPRGSARIRRAIDAKLARAGLLSRWGSSFLVVARPKG